MPVTYDYDIIIVGAGVAGASAAFHLHKQCGESRPSILVLEQASRPGEGLPSRRSGTAVMEAAPTVKMMVQVFAVDSKTFVSHHGVQGAARYLRATQRGLELQKLAARMVLDNPNQQVKELGSFYVGYKQDEVELRAEFDLLQSIGSCGSIDWYDKKKLSTVHGCPPQFDCAIFFPNDAIIDSSSFAKSLIRYCCDSTAASTAKTNVLHNTKVQSVSESGNGGVTVDLESGSQLRCKHAVVATGGLWQIPELNGLLRPCYSYLVHVPTVSYDCVNSSNFFTWGFSHDWSFTNGKVRTSGEDHFSAFKDPKKRERCGNLIRWTLDQYRSDLTSLDMDSIPQQHGVYSETPDWVPLVGTMKKQDGSIGNICYLVGCNAWGQTVLSYASSLVPALLGYRNLTEEERDSMELFSIRRFSELPANH